jgi:hypothetical protein
MSKTEKIKYFALGGIWTLTFYGIALLTVKLF